jgi:hypothetical protein
LPLKNAQPASVSIVSPLAGRVSMPLLARCLSSGSAAPGSGFDDVAEENPAPPLPAKPDLELTHALACRATDPVPPGDRLSPQRLIPLSHVRAENTSDRERAPLHARMSGAAQRPPAARHTAVDAPDLHRREQIAQRRETCQCGTQRRRSLRATASRVSRGSSRPRTSANRRRPQPPVRRRSRPAPLRWSRAHGAALRERSRSRGCRHLGLRFRHLEDEVEPERGRLRSCSCVPALHRLRVARPG